MIFSVTNPTGFVDWLQVIHKMWSCSFWTLPHRGLSLKDQPPRNTPDSFCRRFTPTKSIAALLGRYFSLWETYLENFISRPDVIPTFRQRRYTNRGRNCVRCERWLPYMSRVPLLIFCVLTIRKHLLKMRFERSGRGQEPSRGHKFSIFKNVVFLRDYTSATLVRFRSASCWGVPAPNPAE